MSATDLARLIRDIPDFPKPGILFKDITPLLADPQGFATAIDLLAERLDDHAPTALLAIESRGFIFGSALSLRTGLPLCLVRKHGKLPGDVVGHSYNLEYGQDRIEVQPDVFAGEHRYAIIDDLIATGGTALATVELLTAHGGVVACCAFVVELLGLRGRDRLAGYPVESLLAYD